MRKYAGDEGNGIPLLVHENDREKHDEADKQEEGYDALERQQSPDDAAYEPRHLFQRRAFVSTSIAM